jgi:hypothetical protein
LTAKLGFGSVVFFMKFTENRWGKNNQDSTNRQVGEKVKVLVEQLAVVIVCVVLEHTRRCGAAGLSQEVAQCIIVDLWK